MVLELIGGIIANSISVMSNAAHLLTDVFGFAISIFAMKIARHKATPRLSYGYLRSEVIGALLSVLTIWFLTIYLLYEATLRIINPPEVEGVMMLYMAIGGFLFNILEFVILACPIFP